MSSAVPLATHLRLFVLVAACLAAPRAPIARADFVVDAPCSSADAFLAKVAELTHLETLDAAQLQSIQVHAQPSDSAAWTLSITLPGATPQALDRRELTGSQCEALIDAASVVVSLWLKEQPTPSATAPAAQAAAAATPVPSATRSALDDDPPPMLTVDAPATEGLRVRWGASLGLTGAVGLTPGLSGAGTLVLRMDGNVVTLSLGASAYAGRTLERTVNTRRVPVEVSLQDLWIDAAWFFLRGQRLHLGVRASLGWSWLAVAGRNLDEPASSATLMWRSELGLMARWQPKNAGLGAWSSAGLGLPWSRPQVVLDDGTRLFQIPALHGVLSLGLDLWTE